MLHAIGKITNGVEITNDTGLIKTIGYRVYDSKTDRFIDTSVDSIAKVLYNGGIIKNLELTYKGCVEWAIPSYMCGGIISIVDHNANYFVVLGIDEGVYVCVNSYGKKRYFTHMQIMDNHQIVLFNALVERDKDTITVYPPYDITVKAKKRNVKPEIENTNNKLTMIGCDKFHIMENGGIMVKDKTITSIKIPSSCNKISTSAFKNCELLKQVYIPDSVTNICNGAFEYCSTLTQVRMGTNVNRLGNNAFKHTGIKQMLLPNGLLYIGDKAFNNCKDLELLVIPSSVEFIGYNSLYNLLSLKKIVIPAEIYHNYSNLGLDRSKGSRGDFEIQLT